jgi:hypothetical protein
MEPIIFQPKDDTAVFFVMGFFALILIYFVFNLFRRGQSVFAIVVIALMLVSGVFGFKAYTEFKKEGPITLYADHIGTNLWSIPLSDIKLVYITAEPLTSVGGGTNVSRVKTQTVIKRLIIKTVKEEKEIAADSTYDIEAIKVALEKAVAGVKK